MENAKGPLDANNGNRLSVLAKGKAIPLPDFLQPLAGLWTQRRPKGRRWYFDSANHKHESNCTSGRNPKAPTARISTGISAVAF